MENYSQYIDPTRRSVASPQSLVDENGRCVFGTFDREIEEMELTKLAKPTHAPQCLNRLKLTLWEAAEVHLKNGVLLAVVCDMGIFGLTLNVFYDKRTKKCYGWQTKLKSKDTIIAPNLLHESKTMAETPDSFVRYINDFGNGKCKLAGHHADESCASIEYSFELTRISKPSVVSIPFGENRPLYSQKDFFKAEGRLVIDGEELLSDEDSVAIVDDHRGYYPRRAHYDWVTTMGRNASSGENKLFAFNLTRNQSTNQARYNENVIWQEKKTSLLPPVLFTRVPQTKDFADSAIWKINDEYDMVNVTFKVHDIFPMITHAIVVNIDYYIAFGELEGYIRDEAGNKYILDGMMGMGEDKTLLL